MEISSLEIDLLCKRISAIASGYYLSGIYSMQRGVLLRLNHETKPELMVAIAYFATWVTEKNLSLPEADSFVQRVRELIVRDKLMGVEQVNNERVARFSFENRKGEWSNLYAEFFGGGNQILTKRRNDSDLILEASRPQMFRHRAVLPGNEYVLPPARGVSLASLTSERLESILNDSRKTENQKLSAIQWFGRNVGTSRKFVEEIFSRANVRPESLLEQLTFADLRSLSGYAKELVFEIENSKSGFLLLPGKPETESINQSLSVIPESDLGILDACPIIPRRWKALAEEGVSRILSFSSLNDALDEAQAQTLILEGRALASKKVRSKVSELESALRRQKDLIEENEEKSEELKKIAIKLMGGKEQSVSQELIQRLMSLGILQVFERNAEEIQFVSEPRPMTFLLNSRSVASRLFDEAKRLRETNVKLTQVKADLEKRKEKLSKQTFSSEERAEKRAAIDRRPREWFERYRWFITSDYRLVIGGRDNTSNSIVINKYADPQDLIFHADLHGSPFFVLKNSLRETGAEATPNSDILDPVAQEVAQATVSFSRAWKDELGTANAYWVRPDQVKKSAPTGQYLPRGSFYIEGRKNFVKNVKVELAVAIIDSKLLGRFRDSNREGVAMDSLELESSLIPENTVIICGPEKSLSKYSLAIVQITRGNEKRSSVAKKIKQQLIGKLKESRLKDLAKKQPINDIIRVLPSGTYKIITEKQKC